MSRPSIEDTNWLARMQVVSRTRMISRVSSTNVRRK